MEALASSIDRDVWDYTALADRQFKRWLGEWRRTNPADVGRLDIGRSKRVGNVSATLVDTDAAAGTILIRPVFYHTNPKARPCYWVRRHEAPAVFESYKAALEQMWTHCRRLG
jgi:hypothetical protein